MRVVESSLVEYVGAAAITVWPFVFISPFVPARAREVILTHERVHCAQQRRWALYGIGVGLLVWHLLYLLALPFGVNPWRAKWEREAYRANGYTDAEITAMLRERPYYLWWRQ